MIYAEITVAGKLDPQWSDWFDGLEIISRDAAGTTLRGILPDQSAVHGMMTRMSGLGMMIVSMTVQDQIMRNEEIP